MSTIAFLNIGMHGHINPTLPVVAELVQRGHTVVYHTSPAFREEIGPTARRCSPTPLTSLSPPSRRRSPGWRRWRHTRSAPTARPAPELRRERPDLIVHDSACPWGRSPLVNSAFRRPLRSPRSPSTVMSRAPLGAPGSCWPTQGPGPAAPGAICGPVGSCTDATTPRASLLDLADIRQALNLVLHVPGVPARGRGVRPVVQIPLGPSVGARPPIRRSLSTGSRTGVVRVVGSGVQRWPAALRRFRHRARYLRARWSCRRAPPIRARSGHCRERARPPLRAQPEDAGPRGAVRHPRRNEQRQLEPCTPESAAADPAGRGPAMVARRVVELGAGLSMRTQDIAGTPFVFLPTPAPRTGLRSGRDEPEDRPAQGGRTPAGPSTNWSGTRASPTRFISRLGRSATGRLSDVVCRRDSAAVRRAVRGGRTHPAAAGAQARPAANTRRRAARRPQRASSRRRARVLAAGRVERSTELVMSSPPGEGLEWTAGLVARCRSPRSSRSSARRSLHFHCIFVGVGAALADPLHAATGLALSGALPVTCGRRRVGLVSSWSRAASGQ